MDYWLCKEVFLQMRGKMAVGHIREKVAEIGNISDDISILRDGSEFD